MNKFIVMALAMIFTSAVPAVANTNVTPTEQLSSTVIETASFQRAQRNRGARSNRGVQRQRPFVQRRHRGQNRRFRNRGFVNRGFRNRLFNPYIFPNIIIQDRLHHRDRCRRIRISNLVDRSGKFMISDGGFYQYARPRKRICIFTNNFATIIHDRNNNGRYDYGDGLAEVRGSRAIMYYD